MKINLKQNSWAWFQHRKNYVNASEIGTITGLNPYETMEDLIKKKLFKPVFITNPAMEHGKKTEPKANLFFSVKTNRNYEPTVFTRDIFSASLDGYHEESNTMLEIKCPMDKNSSAWKDFFEKDIIPPYYWAQIQCCLYCSESKSAFFLVYFNNQEYYLREVFIDPAFIEEMKIKGLEYKNMVEQYKLELKENDGLIK